MTKFFSVLLIALLATSCGSLKNFSNLFDKESKTPEFRTMWSKNLDPVYDSGNLPISLQSPLIMDGLVLVGDNNGYFRCFELETGRQVWSQYEDTTYHSKPVTYKDQVIYGSVSGRVYSRNAITGDLKYSVDLGASVETEGVIDGGKIFFQLRNHQVFALDVETGKVLWAYKRSVPYLTTLQRASKPVIYKNKLYVGFADGSLTALNLEEGLLLFEAKLSTGIKFIDLDNPITIIDDKIYVGIMGGPLHILNADNGSVIKRSEIVASRAPILEGEEIIIPLNNGSLVRTDKNLNIVNEKSLLKGAISGVVSTKNSFLVSSTEGDIAEVNKLTFQIIRKKHLGHTYSAVFGDLEAKEGFMAVFSSRNRLYLFK